MKGVPVGLFATLSCAGALGETVRFEPAARTVDLGTGVTTTTFEVHVESTTGVATFNSIDLLIGSDTLVPSAFAFDPDNATTRTTNVAKQFFNIFPPN